MRDCIGYVFLSKNKRNRFGKANIKLCFPNLDTKGIESVKNIVLLGRVMFWYESSSEITIELIKIFHVINGGDLLQRYEIKPRSSSIFKHSLHLEQIPYIGDKC